MNNSLEIQVAERQAESHGGITRTGRVYAEFLIDGMPLSAIAKRMASDNISSLGWGAKEFQDQIVSRLLVESEPASDDRVPLYVCPECGDLACGALTAKVERDGNDIVWSDFAYETGLDLDPPDLNRPVFADVGPYRFAVSKYEPVIRAAYGIGGFIPDVRSKGTIASFLKRFFRIA
jgi:hypothetical protein